MELLWRFSVYSSQPHVTDEANNHYIFIFDYDAKFPSLSISEKIEISTTLKQHGLQLVYQTSVAKAWFVFW